MEESWYASMLRLPLHLFAALLLLSGCVGSDISKARQAEGNGDEFSRALTDEYREFAMYEADLMYDWPDAGHFARKTLSASAGNRPDMELVTDWNVPKEEVGRLQAAREGLVILMKLGAIETAPSLTAKTQASFDCWVEQAEEVHQFDHIAACRKAYFAGLLDLQDALTQRHTAYFDFGRHNIRRDAKPPIGKASARAVEIANLTTVEVTVAGHTDTVGSARFNQRLSEKRARNTADAMIKQGTPPGSLTARGFGFTRLAVPTGRGVREQRNRRADIDVKPIVLDRKRRQMVGLQQ